MKEGFGGDNGWVANELMFRNVRFLNAVFEKLRTCILHLEIMYLEMILKNLACSSKRLSF